MTPCSACPWIKKGQPDITPPVRVAAERGDWFCCHVHMGTCVGAQLVAAHAGKEASDG